jgi:hypothetical protein
MWTWMWRKQWLSQPKRRSLFPGAKRSARDIRDRRLAVISRWKVCIHIKLDLKKKKGEKNHPECVSFYDKLKSRKKTVTELPLTK